MSDSCCSHANDKSPKDELTSEPLAEVSGCCSTAAKSDQNDCHDHSKTDWPLTGQHNTVSCRECHFTISEENKTISQNFSNLDTNCAACHDNIHGDSFAEKGITDCSRCHVTTSWFPEKFDHSDTRFPLTGQHLSVNCKACHVVNNENNISTVVYKLNKLDCKDCHL